MHPSSIPKKAEDHIHDPGQMFKDAECLKICCIHICQRKVLYNLFGLPIQYRAAYEFLECVLFYNGYNAAWQIVHFIYETHTTSSCILLRITRKKKKPHLTCDDQS